MVEVPALSNTAPPSSDLRSRLRPEVWVLVGITLAFGLVDLGAKSVIYDETVTGGYTFLSWGQLWHVITGPDPNMALYYVFIHIWAALFGHGPTALRTFSVIAGAMSIPAIVAVGRRLFGYRAACFAAFFLAVNACFLFYNQEARGYSLLVLLTLASTLLFLRALEDPTPARLASYAVVAVLSVYTHYFAALVLLVHFLGWLTSDERRDRLRAWLMTAGAVVLGCVPEAVVAPHDSQNIDWLGRPTLHALLTFPTFLNGGPVPYGRAPELCTAILVALVIFWVLTSFRERTRWATRFALLWLFLPVLLDFAESSVGKTFWNPRYLLIVLPPFLLLAGAALARMRRHTVEGGIAALFALLSVINIRKIYDAPAIDNYKTAAPYLFAHARAADVAIYDQQNTESDTHHVDSGIWYYGELLHSKPPAFFDLMAAGAGLAGPRAPRRLWFIRRNSDGGNASVFASVRRQLSGTYRQEDGVKDFGQGPMLVLFVRRH